MTKCDHCDKEATHSTIIWFLCDDCAEEYRDGMKAQAEALTASGYEDMRSLCQDCEGTGYGHHSEPCLACNGSGYEPTQEELDALAEEAWQEALRYEWEVNGRCASTHRDRGSLVGTANA